MRADIMKVLGALVVLAVAASAPFAIPTASSSTPVGAPVIECAQDPNGGDGWTPGWRCTYNALANTHAITHGGDTWSHGAHDYIPGNCDVHTNFIPPENDGGGGNGGGGNGGGGQ